MIIKRNRCAPSVSESNSSEISSTLRAWEGACVWSVSWPAGCTHTKKQSTCSTSFRVNSTRLILLRRACVFGAKKTNCAFSRTTSKNTIKKISISSFSVSLSISLSLRIRSLSLCMQAERGEWMAAQVCTASEHHGYRKHTSTTAFCCVVSFSLSSLI